MALSRTISLFIILLFTGFSSSGQVLPSNEAEYDSIYAINIKLSKINGVYIPKDLFEAHQQLIKLTPKESLDKFKMAEEKEVCKKLHFGIGRWMIVNWNFYDGSRMSHYLKEKGVLHPDDMAQFILRTFHRNLNKLESDQENIIKELAEARKKEAEYLINN
ncbi:MAG: hypothetical protein KJO29_04420 [Bacteroidia bacterium]|nr:hypothetical protein [Bacteroidia bacterium]